MPGESTIRSLPILKNRKVAISGTVTTSKNRVPAIAGRLIKRNHKRLVRYGLLAGNVAIVLVAIFIVIKNSGGASTSYSALNTLEETKNSNPLDTLSATDIAANVALMAALPETGLIINDADSVSAALNDPVSSREAVYKPQILSPVIKTKADIKDYVVKNGDTMASLSEKFGVTSDSIRWSNSLSNSSLDVGTKLVIPPINGIVHKVKTGETAETLANKYHTDKTQIIQFNDAEVRGLRVGERIVVPGGSIKVVRTYTSTSTPYYAGFAFGNTAIYGYNGYVPGYCTWYVANKRMQIGRPVPANLGNAATWDNYAPQGWDRTPRAGAAVVTAEYGAGHVVFVEKVNADGSVLISEMNRRRLYEVSTRVWSATEAKSYKYIH